MGYNNECLDSRVTGTDSDDYVLPDFSHVDKDGVVIRVLRTLASWTSMEKRTSESALSDLTVIIAAGAMSPSVTASRPQVETEDEEV